MYDPLVVDAFLRIHAELKTLPVAESAPDAIPQPRARQPQRSRGGGQEDSPVVRYGERTISVDLRSDVGKKLFGDRPQRHPRIPRRPVFARRPNRHAVCSTRSRRRMRSGGRPQVRVEHGVLGWVAATRRAMANSDAFLDLGENFPLRWCSPQIMPKLARRSRRLPVGSCPSVPNRGEPFLPISQRPARVPVRQFVDHLGSRANTLDDALAKTAESRRVVPWKARSCTANCMVSESRVE